MTQVLVLDYSGGNAASVLRALAAAGAQGIFSNDPAEIERAEAIVLPGVGHAGRAADFLRSSGLVAPLEEAALARRVPVLGICLGMQLMTDWLEEGDTPGLGWIGGRTARLAVSDRRRFKVPNIGWSLVDAPVCTGAFAGQAAPTPYYFCHKYEVVGTDPADAVAAFTYEDERVAAIARGNLTGVQFHPEKSFAAGIGLIRDWLAGAKA
jgi:glutamine amidotransferase